MKKVKHRAILALFVAALSPPAIAHLSYYESGWSSGLSCNIAILSAELDSTLQSCGHGFDAAGVNYGSCRKQADGENYQVKWTKRCAANGDHSDHAD